MLILLVKLAKDRLLQEAGSEPILISRLTPLMHPLLRHVQGDLAPLKPLAQPAMRGTLILLCWQVSIFDRLADEVVTKGNLPAGFEKVFVEGILNLRPFGGRHPG